MEKELKESNRKQYREVAEYSSDFVCELSGLMYRDSMRALLNPELPFDDIHNEKEILLLLDKYKKQYDYKGTKEDLRLLLIELWTKQAEAVLDFGINRMVLLYE